MVGKACCFTGHRQMRERPETVRPQLEAAISRLATAGYTDFYCGGALGFDLLAGETVLALKGKFPGLRLLLALPCPPKEQTVRWNETDKARYARLLREADGVHIVCPAMVTGCMQVRNRYMVEHSDYCLAYQTRHTGGTAQTTALAWELGREVENLAAFS